MYTTQEQVEHYLKRPMSDAEAELFPLLETGVRKQIDVYCARTFEASEDTDTSQIYDGGSPEIFLDVAAQSISSIEYIDPGTGSVTTVDPTFYVTFPYNSTPITSIMMKFGSFGYGYKNVRVNGVFGDFLNVPEDIQLASTIMCGHIMTIPVGGLTMEAIEGYTRKWEVQEMPPTVLAILQGRRRILL